MKTFPICRDDGSMKAFEIRSAWITFHLLFKILRAVEGVGDAKRNRKGDDRVVFRYRGEDFVVNEPWGDNSRYWIGPRDAADSPLDVSQIQEAFVRHQGVLSRAFAQLLNAMR